MTANHPTGYKCQGLIDVLVPDTSLVFNIYQAIEKITKGMKNERSLAGAPLAGTAVLLLDPKDPGRQLVRGGERLGRAPSTALCIHLLQVVLPTGGAILFSPS